MPHVPTSLAPLALAVVVTAAGADVTSADAPADVPSLRGRLLVATDEMDDDTFQGTRILMLLHEGGGAVGVIVNRPLAATGALSRFGRPVFDGGPVGRQGVIVLHDDEAEGDVMVLPGVFASAEPALVQAIVDGAGPARADVFVGYAGWGPGQLERELALGVWRIEP